MHLLLLACSGAKDSTLNTDDSALTNDTGTTGSGERTLANCGGSVDSDVPSLLR